MLNKKDFLKKYPTVTDEKIKTAKLSWAVLEGIHDDYVKNHMGSLDSLSAIITSELMKVEDAHSVRFRVKNAEHLIEKIIRKCLEEPERKITIKNYLQEITDLMGVRVLHLFKESWISLHEYIINKWNLKENPTAYIRKGDSDIYSENAIANGCDVKEHKYGYRSLHYIIETQPSKYKYYVEIQVRTIFEEGWSEIDHKIRYPYNIQNPIYTQYTSILNRLSGMSDEMGSFINVLQKFIQVKDNEIEERGKKIQDLEEKISKSGLKQTEKEEFISGLNSIKQYDFSKFVFPFLGNLNNNGIFANFDSETLATYAKLQIPPPSMGMGIVSQLMSLSHSKLEASKSLEKSNSLTDLNKK